jgi:serine protease AprX
MSARLPVTVVVIGVASVYAPPAVSDCDSERVLPPLRVCTMDGLTTFMLEGGEPFHETGSAVHDVRVVVVPGSTILLVLWDEEAPDGTCWPHYGVSYDERSVARLQRTSYDLELRYAWFDPAQGEPAIAEDLRVSDANENVYLVQFVTHPLKPFRDRVRALGGVIYSCQANHAYLVRMSAETRQQVQDLPYVRAVVLFHPAYKSAQFCDGGAPAEDAVSYNILVFEPGAGQMQVIAERVRAIGGSVDALPASGALMRATLTGQQLREVVRLPEVAFVGRDSPPEPAVDIGREIGGANFVHDPLGPLGFTGEGVTGEVMEWQGDPVQHVEYPGSPEHPDGFRTHGGVIYGDMCDHSTKVMGIVFATGAGTPPGGYEGQAKGFLPGAGAENRIVAEVWWLLYDNESPGRRAHTQQLVDEPLDWKAVFQSNSWGTRSGEGAYSAVTSELDDMLCDPNCELLLLHAGGNFPYASFYDEALAKNVLTIGGIEHQGTLAKGDDEFPYGYPQGPTPDGRIKPDLVHFMDHVLTTKPLDPYTCEEESDSYDEDFGGTSAATPITGGHAGLFLQMWHEGVFWGFGGGESVFDDAPHISTTKAMLINTAAPYPMSQLTRKQQGWGMVDLRRMYDARQHYLILDEDETLLLDDDPETPAPDVIQLTYVVSAGMDELRATLVYTDAPGNPWSGTGGMPPWGGASVLKNDLDLRVISPGGTTYWGNYGLGNQRPLPAGVDPSNWSLPNGWADDHNNVENVFIEDPAAGNWIVRVSLRDLVEDGHRETPELDADFALVVTTLPSPE